MKLKHTLLIAALIIAGSAIHYNVIVYSVGFIFWLICCQIADKFAANKSSN
jgi:hypothetical protein